MTFERTKLGRQLLSLMRRVETVDEWLACCLFDCAHNGFNKISRRYLIDAVAHVESNGNSMQMRRKLATVSR